MAAHNDLGRLGEQLAADWLVERGFTVLERNWRHSRAEVDIIACRALTLHFIEIKTRSSSAFGLPETAVTTRKIRQLMGAGAAYQEQYPGWKRVQYDILSVMLTRKEYVEYFFVEDIYT